MVQFCDDCGSMMQPDGDEMVCASCGTRTDKDADVAADFLSTNEQSGDELIETEEGADFEGKPTAEDINCDECGHSKAWYSIKQTGAADEPPTRFFKCEKRSSVAYP